MQAGSNPTGLVSPKKHLILAQFSNSPRTRYAMRQFGAVLRNSTLAQLTARGVRQNFLGGSDKRRTAPNCRSSLGAALMARGEQLPRPSYTIQPRSSERRELSERCCVASRSEARKSLRFILKAGNDV